MAAMKRLRLSCGLCETVRASRGKNGVLALALMSVLWMSSCGLNDALTNDVIDAFITKFNFVRREEANSESVGNMFRMRWNSQLSFLAQRWADQCKFDHSHTPNVGETIFVTSHDSSALVENPGRSIGTWMEEKAANADGSFSCCDTTCGHYCEVIKDVNSEVGCGVTRCSHVLNYTPGIAGTITVCLYKPRSGGSSNVYKHGAPCSLCGAGTQCQYSLCLDNEYPIG